MEFNVELKVDFENKFLSSMHYLSSLLGCGVDFYGLQGRPCWISYGLYNELIQQAEIGNVSHCNQILSEIKHSFVDDNNMVISLYDKEYPLLNKRLIQGELAKHRDKAVSCGLIESDVANKQRSKLIKSIDVIKLASASLWSLLNCFVDEIVITGSADGHYVQSAASFNLFGLIMIYGDPEKGVAYYLEHVIHELSHILLYTVNAKDKVVLNEDDERFKAPYREDLRPMDGIYHAYFVMSNIIYYLNQIKNNAVMDDGLDIEIENRIQDTLSKFYETYGLMVKSARFTEIGKEIFLDSYEKVRSLSVA